MRVLKTEIDDLFIIEPNLFEDSRGYFMESFNEKEFKKYFQNIKFIQDNESKSSFGVLRGLHYQTPPFAQTKLVRVIKGKVLDVVVDLRKNSSTFGKHFSIILSAENKKQFLIPKGFAHGFLVLSNEAIFSYKVDNIYSPNNEEGIIYDDETLKIDWTINKELIKVSKKDLKLCKFNKIKSKF